MKLARLMHVGTGMRSHSLVSLCFLTFTTVGCSPSPTSNDAGSDAGSDANNSVDAPNDVAVVACVPASCPSGHCAPDNTCAKGCTSSSGCAANETCCNNSFCSNLAKDPQNCGACGTACTAKQFCSGTGCYDAVVMNLCQNATASVVLDGIAIDEDAGAVVGGGLKTACTSVTLVTISQGANGSMDPSNGRPELGPGNTYVAAGGGFGQKAVGYMNGARDAPVYTVDDGQNLSFLRTADNSTIIMSPITNLTAHHDYFLVYAAAEPVSGTLVFAVYGLYGAGTAAGAYWFKTTVVPSLSTYSLQYYVFEWTDTNNNGMPDAADTFKQLAAN